MINRFSSTPAALLRQTVDQYAAVACSQAASVHHHRERRNLKEFLGMFKHRKSGRHWNHYEFREARGKKFCYIVLPIDGPTRNKLLKGENSNPALLRQNLLDRGMRPIDLQPQRPWQESQVIGDTAGEIFDPFLPKSAEEEDNLLSRIYKKTSKMSFVINSQLATIAESIKKAQDEEFDKKTFIKTAESMFIDLNNAIVANDERKISDMTTPNAFQSISEFTNLSTIKWQFGGLIEPSVITSARHKDMPEQSQNFFAQVIVRIRSNQALAVYDQFGRIKVGDADNMKPTTDFVVLERHISKFGRWRIHGLVSPDSQPARSEPKLTGPPPVPKDDPESSRMKLDTMRKQMATLAEDEEEFQETTVTK